MLTYPMEERGRAPLYEYLYRRIRADILSGTLAAGERLPSKRALAEHLNVSVVTVEGAYRQLEAEGYLSARPRRGFFVSPMDRLPARGEDAPAPLPAAEEARPSIRLDLRSDRVDAAPSTASVWAKLTRQVLSEGGGPLLSPAPPQGLLMLRQAIARDLRERKGMAVSPEQIVVGAGAEYLYILLAQLLAGSVFAVEDPGYPKISQVYGKCGVDCRPVGLDSQGLDLEALERSGASVAHLSPAHHFPTGLVTPIGRRQSLLRWAEERRGVVIEDDYDSELRYTGRPLPTLQSIDHTGRVVYMNTFSRTISPALRMGFMVLPPRLLDRYRRELGFYACTVPALDQHVLARFLAGGHYERHLSRMRRSYRARRDQVLSAFRSGPFADKISIFEQGAGLHFLLRLETDQSDEALRRRAEDLGVRLGFLSEYAKIPRPEYGHIVVVDYAGLREDRLPEAVALLAEVFREL